MNKQFLADSLEVSTFETRNQMGEKEAQQVFEKIQYLLTVQEMVNIIFAAAPSQNEFLKSLKEKQLNWNRVNAFHMDEYVGLDQNAPQLFGNFLRKAIFDHLPFNSIHYLNGNIGNISSEMNRYEQLLTLYPADIVCMGIGENGHLAFNDPPVADFADKQLVKTVELDYLCRVQQVNDGCFKDIEDVPTHAITLTIPALMGGKYIYCAVPGARKAMAVYNTLHMEIAEKYPSTILRKHNNAIMFLDSESSVLL